jgi:hypothetical protein
MNTKLGASRQLECWNAGHEVKLQRYIGKMGLGILQYWVNSKIRIDDKILNG